MHSSIAKSWTINALPFLAFVVAYLLDHALTNIALYPVYLVPILWATSKWGSKAGIPLAVLSAGLSTPMHFSLEWSRNILHLDVFISRAITLAMLTLFFSNYKKQVKSHKRRIDRLRSIVPQCPDCGAVFCSDGQWRPLEQLISNPENYGVMPRHDCIRIKQPTKP